jgi:hypothetical protein
VEPRFRLALRPVWSRSVTSTLVAQRYEVLDAWLLKELINHND